MLRNEQLSVRLSNLGISKQAPFEIPFSESGHLRAGKATGLHRRESEWTQLIRTLYCRIPTPRSSEPQMSTAFGRKIPSWPRQ